MFIRGEKLVIKCKSLDHSGGYYFYRIHKLKSEGLNNGFSPLKKFLNDVFEERPDEYFRGGPRSSKLKFNIPGLDIKGVTGHEVCGLTSMGLEENHERYKTAHSKVQVFMLEADDKTVAVEVPIWLHADELEYYEELFQSKKPLTGHIDVLRLEGDKVWVWDYKPNAVREKFAATQVNFYALMLSKRSGIPLNKFRCGYFDSAYAFMFKPKEKIIRELDGKLI